MPTAMEKACACISAAFRPERKEHQEQILKASWLKELVTSHRYTFQQAVAELEANVDEMLWSFDWMALDNAALSIDHDHDFHMYPHEHETWAWLRRITGHTVQ